MTERKHTHAEAFMVMRYQCYEKHVLWIWNSRDGVTPFAIACKTDGCEATMYHENWRQDRYEPNHSLQTGDYYWRDGTPEEARKIVQQRLEMSVGTDYERPRSEWPAVIDEIVHSQEFHPGWPMLDRCLPSNDPSIEIEQATPALGAIMWASSGYGLKTRKPFVEVHWRDVKVQMDPPSARDFALNMLGAAEAAEQDAFIIEWLQKSVGADFEGAARLLLEYRKYREEQMKQRGGR